MSTEQEANQEQAPTALSPQAQATLRALSGTPTTSTVEEEALIKIGSEATKQVETPSDDQPADNVNSSDTQKVGENLLKESISKTETEEKNEPEAASGEDPGEVEDEAKTEAETDSSKETSEKEEKKEETFIESPLFGGKKSVKSDSKPTEEVSFEGVDKANEYIKAQTGVEDIQTLVTQFEDSKQKLEVASANEATLKNLEKFFNELPSELYQVVDAYNRGENWKRVITDRPNLNFETPVDQQDERSLVDQYNPGEFSEEQWDEFKSEDGDNNVKQMIKMAIRNSKKQYEFDKKKIDSFRQTQVEEAAKRNEAYLGSVDNSINYLKENIQGVDDGYIGGVKKKLNAQGIMDMFFEKDGSLKKEAAQRYAMAEHGFNMLKQYEGIANHKAESKVRQEVLERVPEKTKAKKKAAEATGNVRPEVQAHIDKTLEGTVKTTVY